MFVSCTVENDKISINDCPKPNPTEVQICSQVWMNRNLDVDHYRNGDSIPQVTDSNEWVNLKTGAWCYYTNDPAMGSIYGKLYNWYAVNDPRGLAPIGWHIPSDTEWTELENCLGGVSIAGGKLKTTGTKESGNGLWNSPNTGATNESGFSALPGGWRTDSSGAFSSLGYYGSWWTSTEINFREAWHRHITSSSAIVIRDRYYKDGFSVRCVKD